MSKDKIKPGSEAFFNRQSIWKHNSFYGRARMMQMQAGAIIDSKTATDEAKQIAKRIFKEAMALSVALKTRNP